MHLSKRLFDILFSIIMLIVLSIPMLFIAIFIRLSSKGPSLYWSNRVGKNNKIFRMPKFRSMLIETPALATHLLGNSKIYLSPIGGFLRRTSLDELPQLISVLKGDMSFVGPRPALFNQTDLISLRRKKRIDSLLPGITGWAQINGRDNLSITEKVVLDAEYLNRQSLHFDINILLMTIINVTKRKDVSH